MPLRRRPFDVDDQSSPIGPHSTCHTLSAIPQADAGDTGIWDDAPDCRARHAEDHQHHEYPNRRPPHSAASIHLVANRRLTGASETTVESLALDEPVPARGRSALARRADARSRCRRAARGSSSLGLVSHVCRECPTSRSPSDMALRSEHDFGTWRAILDQQARIFSVLDVDTDHAEPAHAELPRAAASLANQHRRIPHPDSTRFRATSNGAYSIPSQPAPLRFLVTSSRTGVAELRGQPAAARGKMRRNTRPSQARWPAG
jgi:hypothetical protein